MSMRIGMVCHFGCGGSAQVAVNLAAGLADRGHDLHLFTRSTPFGLAPGVRAALTSHVMSTGAPATPLLDSQWSSSEIDAFVALICDVVRRERLDLLHFHYAVPFAVVLERVRRALGRAAPATVGTLHGTDVSVFAQETEVRRELTTALAGLDALTTVSHSHAELATATLELARSPRVIPNFADLDRFRPHPVHHPRERPRILHVSNFRPVKQPEQMARIADGALEQVAGELWLVGDGEGMPAVERILEHRIARDQVRRFGLRQDVENLVPEADVLLVTSRTESFCLVALEAAACGVPVVAPEVGGLPEVVRHGRTGLLFEPGNEAQAIRRVVRILTDDPLRARMREAALEQARALSTGVVVPRYEALYRAALRARRPADLPAAVRS